MAQYQSEVPGYKEINSCKHYAAPFCLLNCGFAALTHCDIIMAIIYTTLKEERWKYGGTQLDNYIQTGEIPC